MAGVLANLGTPVFEPAAVPFTADTAALDYEIHTADGRHRGGRIVGGQPPRCSSSSPPAKRRPVTQLGPVLEAHERFPERVNVGFMELRSRTEITLRVF